MLLYVPALLDERWFNNNVVLVPMPQRSISKPPIVTSLGKRLLGWRKEHSLKANELARIIGLAPSSLSEIESEKTLPSADTLARLLLNTSIDIKWLLTGQGKMDVMPVAPISRGLSEELLGQDKIDGNFESMLEKFIRVYFAADPGKKQFLIAFLHGADPG